MTVSKNELLHVARNALKDHLSRPGRVLYSSHHTICPGDIYFIGLNPGGVDNGPNLAEALAPSLAREDNAYLDEVWGDYGEGEEGKAPLQQRVQWLLGSLGMKVKDVLATNLVFMQSRNEHGITWEDANVCWPVHEALLSIVKPRLILAFGNSGFSPYAYIHSRFGGEQRYAPAGHGAWNFKGFHASIAGRKVFVAGIPHLSRYNPIGKQHLIDWINSEGNRCIES